MDYVVLVLIGAAGLLAFVVLYNLNNINITGRLTAEPELKITQSGISVCSFTLAVKRPFTKDVTDFINCVVWRQGAEYLTQYGGKGAMVAVSGTLTSRTWEDDAGNKRWNWEVQCNGVEVLQSRREESAAPSFNPASTANTAQPGIPQGFAPVNDDDLPF